MTFFRKFAVAWVLGLLLGASSLPVQAQGAGYVSGVPSADGIGKRYMGREIAQVMGWQGAQWLERQEREKEERTDLLLDALQLKPGMVVADIGAGTGYLSRRMSRLVAPSGKVLAVDVQPEMVALLRKAAEAEGMRNITPSLGTESDVRMAPGSVDLAIMVDVYHELSSPFEMLRSVVQSLAPGGQVVFVEYRAEDPSVPIKPLHKMTESQIRREAEILPLQWVRTDARLPWQHVVIFRKK
ncbi:MAG: methyltransferase domain-containing protein [Comamonadaceae bacterium]|nr:MAG: methyltransferase domain-containing protein [Comamonadaceae bacterium]